MQKITLNTLIGRKLYYSVCILVALLASNFAFAVTKTATAASSSNWNTAANWVPAGVPTAADDVIIPSGTPFNINVNVAATCHSLTINSGGTLTLNANSIALTIAAGGSITIGAGGTISGTGTGTTGIVFANGGTFTNNGVFNMNLPANSAGLALTNGTLTVSGSPTTFTIPRITVSGGATGTLINTITGQGITLVGSATPLTGTGKFQNNGVLTIGTGAVNTASNITTFVNTGTLNINSTTAASFNPTNLTANAVGNGISYNCNCAQTIKVPTSGNYFNLSLYGSGIKTVPGGITTIDGGLTVGGSVNFSPTGSTLTTMGALNVLGTGTFTPTMNTNINGYVSITVNGVFNGGNNLTHTVAGDWQNNSAEPNAYTYTGTNTIKFDASTSTLDIDGSATTNFDNLIFEPSGATNVTYNISPSTNAMNVAGNMTFSNANGGYTTLNPSAGVVISNSGSNAGTISGAAILNVTSIANTAPGDFSAQYKFATSTLSGMGIVYNGAGNQSVNATNVNGISDYGNIYFNNTGTKALIANINTSIASVETGVTLNASTFDITLTGDWTNDGTFTAGIGKVTFNGTAGSQAIGGSAITNFQDLDINNTFTGSEINLSAPDVNIVGTLAFLGTNKANINTGANQLSIGNSATVTGASQTTGYVIGNLRRNIFFTGTFIYDLGDATNYLPVTITPTLVSTSGSIKVNLNSGIDANLTNSEISTANTLNKYWTFDDQLSGIVANFDAHFTFANPDDYVGSPDPLNKFAVGHDDGVSWKYPVVSSRTASSITLSGLSASAYMGNFSIGDANPPTFIGGTQPAGNIVCVGDPASFISTIKGYPSTAQWQKSPDGGATWTDISGETSPTYNIASASAGDNGHQFRVKYTNVSGIINSVAAPLQVDQPISNNSISTDQNICSGTAPVTLTGTMPTGGDGITYTYQWQSAANLGGPYADIATATTDTYDPGTLTTTTFYQRVVTSGVCGTSTSNPITITVDAPVTNNTISSDQTICSLSTPLTLTGTVPVGGTGVYTYQWQSAAALAGPYSDINGETSDTYSPGALITTSYYQRVVTSGTCNNISNPITIIVEDIITNHNITADQTICTGTTPAPLTGFTPTGGNGSYTYQWQSAAALAGPYADINGETSSTYAPGVLTTTSYYQRIITSGVCAPGTSNPITITVEQLIANNTISSSQTICNDGSSSVTLTGTTPTGGDGAPTYQWRSGTTQFLGVYVMSDIAGATTDTYVTGPLSITTAYERVVISGVCAPNTSNQIIVTVDQTISNNIISADQTICNGSTPTTLTGTIPTGGDGTSYTYQWQSAAALAGPYTDINGEVSATFDPGSINATNFYQRVVTSGVCATSSSNPITITVDQLINNNVISADQTICSGNTPTALTGTTPTGGSGVYSYQWQSAASLGGPYADIAGVTTDTYDPGALTTTTFYQRVVTSGACADNISSPVIITVNPAIANNTISGDQTICSGASPLFIGNTPTGGDGTYTYQWRSGTTIVLGLYVMNDIAGATSATYDPGPLSVTTAYERVVISGTCADNTSNQIVVTVDQAIANNTVSGDQVVCSGTVAATLTGTTPTGGNGVYTYQWQSASALAGPYTDIAGATTDTYDPGTLTSTIYYQRVVTSGICADNTSNQITITVEQAVANNNISADQSICSGSAPAILTGTTPTGGDGNYIYQWQSASSLAGPYTDISGATADTYDAGILTVTTFYRRNAISGTCTVNNSNVITITVEQAIGNNTVSSGQTICNGSAPSALTGTTPTGGNGTYTYQWQSAAALAGPYTNIAAATTDTYDPGVLATTTFYQRVVTSGVCANNTSNPITITVEQAITNNTVSADQTICFKSTPAVFTGTTPIGGNGAYTYQWQSATALAGPYTDISGATAAAYVPGILTANAFYKRDVSAGTCVLSSSNPISITVIQPVTSFLDLHPEICNVTVDSISGKNLVTWSPDNIAHLQGYNIYRVDNSLLTLAGTVGIGQESIFIDPVADPELQSYEYRITALDSCGNESDTSRSQSAIIHYTIHLTTSKVGPNQQLTWNAPGGNIRDYRLYRQITVGGSFNQFATTDNQTTTYLDTDPLVAQTESYLIIAAGLDTCSIDFIQSRMQQRSSPSDSRSNTQRPSAIDTTTTVGVKSFEAINVRVYPNPTSGKVSVSVESGKHTPMSVVVSDVLGNVLLTKKHATDGQSMEIDLSDYPSNVYIIKVMSEKTQIIKRIVKH